MTASLVEPRIAVEGRQRAVWTRVEVLGLGLVALAPFTLLLAGLLQGGIGAEWVFFASVAAVAGVGAALVWRFGTWAKAVGMVVALLATAAMFWVVFGLAYPASPGDFVPGVLLPLGVVLSLVGGVAAIMSQRRGRLAVDGTDAERRIVRLVAVVVAVVALGSTTASLVTRQAVAADDAAFTATLAEFAFDADTYAVPAGEPTTVRVRNDDGFVHTFTIPELGIDETVLPGSEALVEVTAPAGTYTLYCKPHANLSEPDPTAAGMAARLVAE